MKRPQKFALLAVGVIAGLFVLAGVLVPLLFDPARLKPRAEAKLTQLIGRKVSLGTVRVSLWSGLALRAETLRVGEPIAGAVAGAPAIEAGVTSVRVALLPLLHKEVEARSITIQSARVLKDGKALVSDLALRSSLRVGSDGTLETAGNVEGRLDLLASRPRASASFAATLSGGALELRSLDATAGPLKLRATGQISGISSGTPRARLDLEAKMARSIVQGKVDLTVDTAAPAVLFDLDAPLLDLDELLAFTSTLGEARFAEPSRGPGLVPVASAAEPDLPKPQDDLFARARGKGTIKAARCVYKGLEMTGVAAAATLDRGLLRLDDTRISMFGGTARGTIDAHPFQRARPFTLRQKVDGVAIGKLIAALAPAQKGTVEGAASLELSIDGRGGETPLLPTINGRGALVVAHGKIASLGVIRQVMRLLETAGAKGIAKDETPFDRLSAHFDVLKGVARTQDLQFRSPDLDFDGHGTIGLGGALDLDVVGSFSQTVSDQLVAKTPALEIRQGSDGRLTVPLQLRGTLVSPQVQLDINAVIHEGLKKEVEKDLKKKLLDKLFGH